MFTVRDYEKGDIFKLLLSEKEQYQMQYLREDVLMAPNSVAFTGIGKGKIIGCAGLANMWEGVYEAWIALDEIHKLDHISMFKKLKYYLEDMPEGVVRVQAHINTNTQNYHHFMTFLGFNEECHLKNYFPKKSDCILYTRLY